MTNDTIVKVLKGLPERDPLDFVTVQAGSVAKGSWGDGEEYMEGRDGAGSMDEDEEEDQV